MTNINLTDLEKTVLHDITTDCFYEDGLNSAIWADCFMDTVTIDTKQARGVLGSLVQKNILCSIAKGRNGFIAFTEFGKEVMKELGYK